MTAIVSHLTYISNFHVDCFETLSDDSVSFAVLLKTFQQYEDKGHSTVRQKAMMTLVNSYTGQEELSEEEFKQVL